MSFFTAHDGRATHRGLGAGSTAGTPTRPTISISIHTSAYGSAAAFRGGGGGLTPSTPAAVGSSSSSSSSRGVLLHSPAATTATTRFGGVGGGGGLLPTAATAVTSPFLSSSRSFGATYTSASVPDRFITSSSSGGGGLGFGFGAGGSALSSSRLVSSARKSHKRGPTTTTSDATGGEEEDRAEALSHYLLTSPQGDHLAQLLSAAAGVGADVEGGRVGNAAGPSANIGAQVHAGAGEEQGATDALLEASSPTFAGSPNASPTRRANAQNRHTTLHVPPTADGGAALVPAVGSGAPSLLSTTPQPYSEGLAKALFPELLTNSDDNDAASAAAMDSAEDVSSPLLILSAAASATPSSPSLASPSAADKAAAASAAFGLLSPNKGRRSQAPSSAGTASHVDPTAHLRLSSGGGFSSPHHQNDIGGSSYTRNNNNNNSIMIGRHSASEQFRKSQSLAYKENKARNFQSKSFRIIPQTPERILDAPELLDDFYLNLLDWSSRNTLAVALGSTAYLWSAADGSITSLMATEQRENIITALSWQADGATIAVGLNDGTVELWDAETQTNLRTISGHSARVCSLSWNGGLLASGSRDTSIHFSDARDPYLAGAVKGHTQEVCGLRWSHSGSAVGNAHQLASGGNDNLLNIWDHRRAFSSAAGSSEVVPLWQLRDHTAAVKALAWNPRQPNLLASGGGTADKTLRFWDTARGQCLSVIDTASQVCGVLWNHEGTELVSSHGYSDNQLSIWRYPTLKKLADLTGHTSRVLHLSMSPDGQTVVSAAGDETIRFWNCFAPDPAATATAAASNNPFLASPYSSPFGFGSPLGGAAAAAAGGYGSPMSPSSPKRGRESCGAGSADAPSSSSSFLKGGSYAFDDYNAVMLR